MKTSSVLSVCEEKKKKVQNGRDACDGEKMHLNHQKGILFDENDEKSIDYNQK